MNAVEGKDPGAAGDVHLRDRRRDLRGSPDAAPPRRRADAAGCRDERMAVDHRNPEGAGGSDRLPEGGAMFHLPRWCRKLDLDQPWNLTDLGEQVARSSRNARRAWWSRSWAWRSRGRRRRTKERLPRRRDRPGRSRLGLTARKRTGRTPCASSRTAPPSWPSPRCGNICWTGNRYRIPIKAFVRVVREARERRAG